jgi:hypothetical protein
MRVGRSMTYTIFSMAIENTSAKRSITVGNFEEISVLFCFLLEEEMKKKLVKNINSVLQIFFFSLNIYSIQISTFSVEKVEI